MNLKENWIKNKGTILILLFALFACLYTIMTMKQYEQQCNEHWTVQFWEHMKDCSCVYSDEYVVQVTNWSMDSGTVINLVEVNNAT